MTTPAERTKAVLGTRDFLEISSSPEVTLFFVAPESHIRQGSGGSGCHDSFP